MLDNMCSWADVLAISAAGLAVVSLVLAVSAHFMVLRLGYALPPLFDEKQDRLKG